jgi:IclR family pca regulon transcriptional regulator
MSTRVSSARNLAARANSSPAGLTKAARSQSLPAAEIGAYAGDPNFMSSLARGLIVIRAFNDERRKLTIGEISTKTGVPRSAVRRCLYTLGQLGYVVADGAAFELRPKLLALGHAYLSSTPLAVSAQAFLDRVSVEVHESCSLAILDGDEIVYLARSAASRIMSVSLNVGSRLPAYCTSMGRAILAFLPEDELDAYLKRVELEGKTEKTITTVPRLKQALSAVKHSGYAIVDQELEIGLRSIAVPVRDSFGNVTAAINVSAQAGRMTLRMMESVYLPPLLAASQDLASVLPR